MTNNPIDFETVLQRLRDELSQTRGTLSQIQQVLRSDAEFDGLTIIGGVKALQRRYYEEKEKVFQLEQALKRSRTNKP